MDVEKLESLLYGIYFIMICCTYCGSTVFLLLYGKEAVDRHLMCKYHFLSFL